MRTSTLIASCLLLCACQFPTVEHDVEVIEASYRSSRPLDIDGAAAELVQAMQSVCDQRRRTAMENIANVDTPGFKRRVVRLGTRSITDGAGARLEIPVIESVDHDHSGGAIRETGRSLDVAIDGAGFFQVLLHDGSVGYRRDGSLRINAEGKLVTGDGYIVLPEITVSADVLELSIDPLGCVSARTAGAPDTKTSFGELSLTRFLNPEALRWEHGAYRPTDACSRPVGGAPGSNAIGMLRQGFLEGSNVEFLAECMMIKQLDRRQQSLHEVFARIGRFAQ